MAVKEIACSDCGLVLRIRKDGARLKVDHTVASWVEH